MIAAGTDTAKRCRARRAGERAIPVDDSRANVAQKNFVFFRTFRQQSGGETVTGVVGHGQRVVEMVVSQYLQKWAEVFFIRQVSDAGNVENTGREKRGSQFDRFHFQQ